MKIRVKDCYGNEYSGYWNGTFYKSKNDDIPNLKRVYIDKTEIHLDYNTVEDLRNNQKKYTNAYDTGLYESVVDFFNKLLNWQTKEVMRWEDINITSWNHLKQQYIAIIEKPSTEFGLIRVFISEKTNQTSSGANAELITYEPSKIGTIIEIKDGSHKNMWQKLYRKVDAGWMFLAERKNKESWEMVPGEMPKNTIEWVEPKKQNKKKAIIDPLAKFSDDDLILELQKRGYTVEFEGKKKIVSRDNGDSRFSKLELV